MLSALTSVLLVGCTSPTPTVSYPVLPRPTPSSTRTLVASPEQLAGPTFAAALENLATAAVQEKATLVIPAGTYTTTATIMLPAHTDLRLEAGAEIVGSLPGQSLMRVSADNSLTGGTLSNTAESPGFDLDFAENAAGVHIDGVTFSGPSTNAVYFAAAGIHDVTIERSRFAGVGYGILLNPGAHDATGLTIRANNFSTVCSDAIEINAATGGTDRRVRDVTIAGNHMEKFCGSGESSGFGIGLAGVQTFAVTGNTILGARNEAIHLEDGTSDGRVQGNQIESGGVGTRPAIAIYRSTASIVVQKNVVHDFSGSGIAVLWDSLGSARSISIVENVVETVTGDGIVVAGAAGTGPFRVVGNDIRSVGGNGISVAGSHESSVVADNSLHTVSGSPIAESLRGTGRTEVDGNAIGP